MNNKILINIIVPSINNSYNVYIPINKKIGTIKVNILSTITEMSDGYFNLTIEKSIFIDRDTGKEYDNNSYVKDSGLKNGSKLIIV